jgi:hypothetical protein
MPTVSLTEQEHALLVELLDFSYRNLKEEIGSTDTITYRDQLRERERLLESLMAKVASTQ